VGGECVGGKGSVVTVWERIGGEVKTGRRECMRRGRKSSLEKEQWIFA
jgi:hypothetical protein